MIIINADARQLPIAGETVQTCITSPPYFRLRDYRVRGQLGAENSLEEYINNLVQVFREVWRVLRPDGTLWLNIGDCYVGGGRGGNSDNITGRGKDASQLQHNIIPNGLKTKDLMLIPARLALALQADGWWVRRDVIWYKPNPMPESAPDRPVGAHEYIWLLTKQKKYFYDRYAVLEPAKMNRWGGQKATNPDNCKGDQPRGLLRDRDMMPVQRNIRSVWEAEEDEYQQFLHWKARQGLMGDVWTISTQGTSYAHFATFPERLAELCVLAGSSERGCCPKCGAPYRRMVRKIFISQPDVSAERAHYHRDTEGVPGNSWNGVPRGCSEIQTIGWRPGCDCDAGEPIPCLVLDPFMGSGTVARAAIRHRRNAVGVELSYECIKNIASRRTAAIQVRMI